MMRAIFECLVDLAEATGSSYEDSYSPGDKVSAGPCQVFGQRSHGVVERMDKEFTAIASFCYVDFGDGKAVLVHTCTLRRES